MVFRPETGSGLYFDTFVHLAQLAPQVLVLLQTRVQAPDVRPGLPRPAPGQPIAIPARGAGVKTSIFG